MKRSLKHLAALLTALTLLMSLAACGDTPAEKTDYENAMRIILSTDSAMLDNAAVSEYDYTWHCDPSAVHDEVDNAPAEYYTGTKPDTDAAVYIDHELYYFPSLPESGFKAVNYDGETEWAYYYTDGENDDYIFATLPHFGSSLPTQMMHTEAQASENKVLHICKAGTYILEGSWNGQILVDLGDEDETFTDESARITLVLSGVTVNCTAAPGIVFRSAYECDNTCEERAEHSADIDTSDAGVNVIIADGTENTVTGCNVFRMLKTKYKSDDSTDPVPVQKKMRKLDAAFYSYVTMNVCGEAENTGKLTVNSSFEGIDSELHMTVTGGDITVNSADDGMNVNEDNVSVLRFSGGSVTLNAGLGAEGDGVDSNGYIVIDGGTVSVNGVVPPDSALDSEDGIYYKSGTVIIDGVTQSYTAGDVFRETGNMSGQAMPGQPTQGFDFRAEDFDIKDFKEKVAALGDDAGLYDVLALLGMGERFDEAQQPPDMPQDQGQQPPDKPDSAAPPQGMPDMRR